MIISPQIVYEVDNNLQIGTVHQTSRAIFVSAVVSPVANFLKLQSFAAQNCTSFPKGLTVLPYFGLCSQEFFSNPPLSARNSAVKEGFSSVCSCAVPSSFKWIEREPLFSAILEKCLRFRTR